MRGKTKEGENERASPGADGASANETMLFDNGAVICHECRLKLKAADKGVVSIKSNYAYQ